MGYNNVFHKRLNICGKTAVIDFATNTLKLLLKFFYWYPFIQSITIHETVGDILNEQLVTKQEIT